MALAVFKVGVTIDGLERVEYTCELIKKARPKWMPKKVYGLFIRRLIKVVLYDEKLTDEERQKLRVRFNLPW